MKEDTESEESNLAEGAAEDTAAAPEVNPAAEAAQAAVTQSAATESVSYEANGTAEAKAESAANVKAAAHAAHTAHTTHAAHAAHGGHRAVITKQTVAEYIMRCIVLCIGLFIMSIGVNLSIQADLGTSPISSIPTVLAKVLGFDDIGVTTIVVNAVIALIQIPILRRRYNPLQLLQIPVSTVFGLLCTASSTFLKGITPSAYWDNWLVCVAGIVLVAVGVSIEVATNVTTLAGEGLALSLNKVCPKIKFGYMKVIVDCSLVVIAVVISFACLHELYGVREGTLAAAIFVGLIAKLLNKVTIPAANKFFALPHRKERAETVQNAIAPHICRDKRL